MVKTRKQREKEKELGKEKSKGKKKKIAIHKASFKDDWKRVLASAAGECKLPPEMEDIVFSVRWPLPHQERAENCCDQYRMIYSSK